MPSLPHTLAPAFALALWTFIVITCMAVARIRAAGRGEVTPGDFRYGESARVPPGVALINRNYMNLLELPVLFYVVTLIIAFAQLSTPTLLALQWAYVALRVAHSVVHVTYNNVIHRLFVFALGNLALMALWVAAAWRLAA